MKCASKQSHDHSHGCTIKAGSVFDKLLNFNIISQYTKFTSITCNNIHVNFYNPIPTPYSVIEMVSE